MTTYTRKELREFLDDLVRGYMRSDTTFDAADEAKLAQLEALIGDDDRLYVGHHGETLDHDPGPGWVRLPPTLTTEDGRTVREGETLFLEIPAEIRKSIPPFWLLTIYRSASTDEPLNLVALEREIAQELGISAESMSENLPLTYSSESDARRVAAELGRRRPDLFVTFTSSEDA